MGNKEMAVDVRGLWDDVQSTRFCSQGFDPCTLSFLQTSTLCMSSIAVKTAFYVFPCTENAVPQVNKTCPMVKTALWIFQDTQTGKNKLRRTSTVAKNAFYIFPVTQNGLYDLHRTLTVAKTAFNALPDKQACMSFTGPPEL